MKVIFEHLPTIEIGGQKLVGRVLFGLLVLFSAAVGAAAGLLLVYSTDLPQVEELERYRPSSVTELYAGRGRVIGTFALQRASLDRRQRFLPALGHQHLAHRRRGLSRYRIGRKSAGSIHAHHATRAQSVSLSRPLVLSQSAGVVARDSDGAPLHQAADFHALRQPDIS